MSDKIKQQLKELAQHPQAGAIDRTWMQHNKEILMMQVNNTRAHAKQERTKTQNLGRGIAMWGRNIQGNMLGLVVRPMAVLALIVLIPLGGWVSTVNASLLSVPGDKLYGVKIMTEKVQLSLSSNKKEEITLHTEFAARRADEVAKLKTKAEKKQTQEVEGHIKDTIKRLEKEMQVVNTKLDALAQEETPATVLKVAQNIDQKTEQITAALTNTGGSIAERPEITAVKELVDSTSVKAVETVVKKSTQVQGSEEEKKVLENEIKQTIDKKLRTTASEIEEMLQTLDAQEPTETVELGESTKKEKEQVEKQKELQTQVKAVQEEIIKASGTTGTMEFAEVLTTIKEAKSVVAQAKGAVEVLEKGAEAIKAQKDAEQEKTKQTTADEQSQGTITSDTIETSEQPTSTTTEGAIEADTIIQEDPRDPIAPTTDTQEQEESVPTQENDVKTQ